MEFVNSTNSSQQINKRLNAACDLLNNIWNEQRQSWNSSDGNWYSLNAQHLSILAKSLQLFAEASKMDINVEWLKATEKYRMLKNILSYPSPQPTSEQIHRLVWQLIFDLTRNRDNHMCVWQDYNEHFFECLHSVHPHKDICRLIMFNLYRFGCIAHQEGPRILRIMLENFKDEVNVKPLKKQGLHVFLDFFIVDEKRISMMYLNLNAVERLQFLQITAEHIAQGHFNVSPISIELLLCVWHEFKSKMELISTNFNKTEVRELVALFEIIGLASNETYYGLNRWETELLLNVCQLLQNVYSNDRIYEEAFAMNNCERKTSLKIMLIKTIMNLVNENTSNQNLVREKGIIDTIVDLVCSFGKNRLTYAHSVLAIIEICNRNVKNQEHLRELVKLRNDGNSEILKTLMIDIKYKKK